MIEFDVQGGDDTGIRIHAQGERLKAYILDAISDALEAGEKEMLARVPRDSGALAQTIRIGGIVFQPGGAGGGGYWEAELKVGEDIPYLNIVVEGREAITTGVGNVMQFLDRADDVFTHKVSGYEGQEDWIIAAQQIARTVIEQRIDSIGQVGPG